MRLRGAQHGHRLHAIFDDDFRTGTYVGQERRYVGRGGFCFGDANHILRHSLIIHHFNSPAENGVLPDLRYSGTLENDVWFGVVLDGVLKQAGMVAFAKELSRQDASAIREYVIYRANQSLAESGSQKKP
jgi:hypothetical protein